jgi:hypothetical protein
MRIKKILLISIFGMLMINFLFGEDTQKNNETVTKIEWKQGKKDFYKRCIDDLNDPYISLILQRLEIEDGSKEKKIKIKRSLLQKQHFHPLSLKISDLSEPIITQYHLIDTHRIPKIGRIAKIESDIDYIEPDTILQIYNTEILTSNEHESQGHIEIAYTTSQYYARRYFVSCLTNGIRTKPAEIKDYSYPENIGDDLCFMDNSLQFQYIFFIRDYTVFKICMNNTQKNSILELAKYIDQRFIELNKKLNEKEKQEPTND